MSKKQRIFGADFETTVFDGQTRTDVWSAAIVELYTEDVYVYGNINDFYEYLRSLKADLKVYFHNLKFDGSFIIDYLLKYRNYKQAIISSLRDEKMKYWQETKEMLSKTFKYSISSKGQWYSIVVKEGKYKIEFVDSLKLLPFSLRDIGKAFHLKHQKLEMEYKGLRFPNCPITDDELAYIRNDVLLLKEAIEFMYANGHSKLTIGACCIDEYKTHWFYQGTNFMRGDFSRVFPDQRELVRFADGKKDFTYDNFVRKTYKGGWCYLAKGKENKVFTNGLTLDVTSLYPSVMHSKSGCRYPVGYGHYWEGNYIPEVALHELSYYFIKVNCSFNLREGYLPCIQIKDSYSYRGTECLETSDIKIDGEYRHFYEDEEGNIHPITVTLYLTQTDWELIKEHYILDNVEILSGIWYGTEIGLFDAYIDHYKAIKDNGEGAERTLAKLFLNNLYGKFATSDDSSFKLAYMDSDGNIKFDIIPEHNKKPIYIPIGSAITSYARNFTIRAAQKNYYGKSERGFIYADTDSIHCDLKKEELIDIPISKNELCTWKVESEWSEGFFVRQKTYIELEDDDEGKHYDIKCAGMPDNCKKLFEISLKGYIDEESFKKLNKDQLEFLYDGDKFISRLLTDFKYGLKIPGKLVPKRIPGGILLVETTYELRSN